jgi:dienelactone hydrolase
MLVKKLIEYHDQDVVLEGYYVFDDAIKTQRPLVLVVHDWSGRNELAMSKAEKLAELGYVGFAIDMFGKGKLGTTTEEKSALIKPFMSDRKMLQRRVLAGLHLAKQLEQVDVKHTAAIGLCFGGLCALDLARSGADLNGVVSFHGLLYPTGYENQLIKAKVLALHGYNDVMVPVEQVTAFEKEMKEAHVDWQLHVYGNAEHAFSNPLAHDPVLGTVYNKVADKRSWISMKNFLEEIFS